MKIRKFKDKDAQKVSKLIYDAFSWFHKGKLHWYKKAVSPGEIKKISISRSTISRIISYVAEEKGKIIGYIRGSAHANGLGSLEVVAVDSGYFRRGIGSKLMEKLEEFWHKEKIRKVSTCVSASNKNALMYYLKHDFIPEGYRRDHFQKGIDEIILGRFLK